MDGNDIHVPVLLEKVIKIFNLRPGQIYVDATVNGGGHGRAIAERVGKNGRVIGIDWDCALIEELRIKNQALGVKNIEAVCGSYVNISEILAKKKIENVDGVLFDLGFSSYHLERSGRGFSFQRDEPLDMRYNATSNELTAEKIINEWPGDAIAALLRDFGEERYAERIADAIVRARARRRIGRTGELVSIIHSAVPRRSVNNIHPATRAFQALRIAVNGELEALEKGLDAARQALAPGGRMAVISFHSLEDRIVKNFFRRVHASGIMKILTKKPIRVSAKELRGNPRSRSARLRAAEKV